PRRPPRAGSVPPGSACTCASVSVLSVGPDVDYATRYPVRPPGPPRTLFRAFTRDLARQEAQEWFRHARARCLPVSAGPVGERLPQRGHVVRAEAEGRADRVA